MKLRLLLSLVAVLTVATGLNAIVGDILRAPGAVVSGVGRGLTGRGGYEAGMYAQDRPMERVAPGVYSNQAYAPKGLGNELSVDPSNGEYFWAVGDARAETPRYGNFLTPVE